MVRQPDATFDLASQDNDLMPKHRILGVEPHFDLKGEARTARTKQSSPIIAQLRRFHHVSNSDEVFGTHRLAGNLGHAYYC